MNFFGGAFFGGGFFGPITSGVPASVGGGSGAAGVGFHRRPRHPLVTLDLERKEEIAEKVLNFVAKRQVEALQVDEQKIFEELERELELEDIQFETRYLEALSAKRQVLIHEEIGRLLREQLRLRNEDEAMLLILIAAYLT